MGRMLLELVPGIWIIGGDEEGRGGEGDGGGLERSGIIGEERSGLKVKVNIARQKPVLIRINVGK